MSAPSSHSVIKSITQSIAGPIIVTLVALLTFGVSRTIGDFLTNTAFLPAFLKLLSGYSLTVACSILGIVVGLKVLKLAFSEPPLLAIKIILIILFGLVTLANVITNIAMPNTERVDGLLNAAICLIGSIVGLSRKYWEEL